MVRAIRQSVTIQPGGVIQVRSDELRPGATAEVIVLVDSPQTVEADASGGSGAIALLEAAQRAVRLTPDAAAQWAEHARRQRTASSRRREPPAR